MRASAFRGISGLWLVALLGCGGGGGALPTSTTATASAFCQQVETINIAETIQCYGGTAADWPIFYGASTCPVLDAAVTNGHLTYDPTKAAACLAALGRPLACSADSPVGPSCVASVLIGAVADGAPCESDYVCQPGSTCPVGGDGTDSCPAPTCRHIPVAGETCDDGSGDFCRFDATCVGGSCVAGLKVGDACGENDQPACGPNLYCPVGEAAPTCKRLVEGGLCGGAQDCFSYQYCGPTKHCAARLGLGADCTADSSSCQTFTACDPTTNRCVAASHVGELCGNLVGYSLLCQGGSCLQDDKLIGHCVVPLADGAACANSFECTSGLCAAGICATPPPNDGASCEDSTLCGSGVCSQGQCDNGVPCENAGLCSSHICFGGLCAAPNALGAACGQGSDCLSGACAGGMCVVPGGNGAPCADGTACASGHCAAGTCAACAQ
jgi:hypothetical protein